MRQFFRSQLFPIATVILLISTVTIGILTFRYVAEKASILEISLLDSNLNLIRQTLERVEQRIANADKGLYEYISAPTVEELTLRLDQVPSPESDLIKQIYLLETDGTVLYPQTDRRRLGRFFTGKVLPSMDVDKMLPLGVHHLHISIDGKYRLFSTLKFQFAAADRPYLLVAEYQLDRLDVYFSPYLQNLEITNLVCIRDYDNKLIHGTPFQVSRKYFVEQRFPTTFYKWLLQLAPRNVEQIEQEAHSRRLLNIVLIAINLVLILSAWFLVFLSRRQEIKLSQQKEDFIRNTSHELKTPLSLIKMFSEILLLRREKDDRARQEYLEIIFAETERMTHIINNVLDFANLERGLQRFSFEELQLEEVVRRHLEAFDYRFKKEQVDLFLEVEPQLPPIQGDRNALGSVLRNLLDNASKYSGEKKKKVRIRLSSDNGAVVLQVQDDGIGIPAEDLPRVFEKFYRSNNLQVRRVRGSGIGLSLVEYLVHAHQGDIRVASAPGEGSTFTIVFPALRDTTARL